MAKYLANIVDSCPLLKKNEGWRIVLYEGELKPGMPIDKKCGGGHSNCGLCSRDKPLPRRFTPKEVMPYSYEEAIKKRVIFDMPLYL